MGEIFVKVKKEIGWILSNQICNVVDANDTEYLIECFDGYDGTIKREWIDKNCVEEVL